MKILYTGFEPFGGETVNPSFEAVSALPATVAGAEVIRLEVPVEFDRGAEVLLAAIEAERPAAVICVGQAGGRSAVTPEFVAINYRAARIPDNAGHQPSGEAVCEAGPAAYFTTLPVHRIAERCREEGIPSEVSYTAGTYVCNELMYRLLHAIACRYPGMPGGFVHVPYSPCQAAAKSPVPPSLEVGVMAEALRIAGEETLASL